MAGRGVVLSTPLPLGVYMLREVPPGHHLTPGTCPSICVLVFVRSELQTFQELPAWRHANPF